MTELQYHGTDRQTALSIVSGNIDVTVGGGELGQGFYTGNLEHAAFAWAHHKYEKNNSSVVKFEFDDDDLLKLDVKSLNEYQAIKFRQKIRNNNQTHIFTFGYDSIWAPLVGKSVSGFDQFKYESAKAEKLMNSDNVSKSIINQ